MISARVTVYALLPSWIGCAEDQASHTCVHRLLFKLTQLPRNGEQFSSFTFLGFPCDWPDPWHIQSMWAYTVTLPQFTPSIFLWAPERQVRLPLPKYVKLAACKKNKVFKRLPNQRQPDTLSSLSPSQKPPAVFFSNQGNRSKHNTWTLVLPGDAPSKAPKGIAPDHPQYCL